MTSGLPLEPSADELADLSAGVVDFVARWVAGRADAPASNRFDPALPDLLKQLGGAPGEDGASLDQLLAQVAEAATHGIDTAGPGYFGFVPGGGLITAALADLVATAVNRSVGVAARGPALAQMEAGAVDWIADLVGLPSTTRGGILTSGGSMANFSAVIAARAAKLPTDFLTGTLYATDQTHHSIAKAAMLAGFPPDGVRTVPTDRELRADVDALRTMVANDRRVGRRPFLVVANAGTTNTGAIDPLADLADLAAAEDLWLHVDAAYGGFFLLTERGRSRLAGIDRVDSATLDPHKSLFLPYGTGALVVRNVEALRRSHEIPGAYLQDLAAVPDVPDFAALSPELSRDFRGLRVWLPLQLHGLAAFRAALDEKLDLATQAHARLREVNGLEVPWTPQLSVVAFRHRNGPAATRQVLEDLNAAQRVYLSSTTIAGALTGRLCVLSHRTHADRVDEAVDQIARASAQISQMGAGTRP